MVLWLVGTWGSSCQFPVTVILPGLESDASQCTLCISPGWLQVKWRAGFQVLRYFFWKCIILPRLVFILCVNQMLDFVLFWWWNFLPPLSHCHFKFILFLTPRQNRSSPSQNRSSPSIVPVNDSSFMRGAQEEAWWCPWFFSHLPSSPSANPVWS